jgi:hypothetical protein
MALRLPSLANCTSLFPLNVTHSETATNEITKEIPEYTEREKQKASENEEILL